MGSPCCSRRERRPPFDDPGIVRSVYNGGNPVARVLALVLGIAAMGSEYRHQTLAATYLATPRRTRVLLGKAASLLLFGLLYGVASVLAGVVVAVPFILVNDGSFFFDRADTWRSLVLGVGSLALWTMLGMGIGILIKNMLVAMLVGISFAYLVEPILSLVFFLRDWDLALNLMPTGATNAMLGITSPVLFASDDPFAWWLGRAGARRPGACSRPSSACCRPCAATWPDPAYASWPLRGPQFRTYTSETGNFTHQVSWAQRQFPRYTRETAARRTRSIDSPSWREWWST